MRQKTKDIDLCLVLKDNQGEAGWVLGSYKARAQNHLSLLEHILFKGREQGKSQSLRTRSGRVVKPVKSLLECISMIISEPNQRD